MTGKERIIHAIEHKQADLVPFEAYLSPGHALHLMGRKTHELYITPGLLPEAMINANRFYHADGVSTRADMYRGDEFNIIERNGNAYLEDRESGEITHHLTEDDLAEVPEQNLSYTLIDYRKVPKIKNEEDLERLTVTPKEELLRLRYFKSVRHYVDELGEDTFLIAGACGPSMNAIALCRGLEQGLIDLYENIDMCMQIMEWRAKQLEQETLAFKELGVDCIYTGDAYATCSLVPPEKYRELLFPYQKRHVEFIKKCGMYALLHVCGKTSDILEDLADTGADILEAIEAHSTGGDMEMAEAKRRVGHRVCLKGNIDAKNVIKPGPAERVKEYCLQAMRDGAHGGGLILSTEQVTPDTPPEHVLAMHQARLEFRL